MAVTVAKEDARERMAAGSSVNTWIALRREWPIGLSVATAALFGMVGKAWLADLTNPWRVGLLFVWLFGAVLLSAFAVVRHADCLAIKLGEPYGTLILTLSVIGMEVMMVSAVMLTGGSDPTLARDTMFSVLMIVLNGLFGLALLAGGWRHGEQQYNLQGAVSYLAMLVPLAMLALVLPAQVESTVSPALKTARAWTLGLTSIGLYGVFLAVQTRRHPDFFVEPGKATLSDEAVEAQEHGHLDVRSTPFHAILLLLCLLPVVVLAKKLAVVLDYGVERLGAPIALSGLIVAILILAPEGMTAVRAALGNRLQRSVNLLFGAALTTIALTVPAVIFISLATGMPLTLGLSPANQVLLATTLLLSVVTCTTGRTNVLNGFIHLLLFVAYFTLIF
jgi:Ca2+:H+ antiporter